MRTKHAQFVGVLKGRKVYRVPVVASIHTGIFTDPIEHEHEVLSHSAADAANYVRDLYAEQPQTTIKAYGPKGGVTERWVGWHSAIGSALFAADRSQLTLRVD